MLYSSPGSKFSSHLHATTRKAFPRIVAAVQPLQQRKTVPRLPMSDAVVHEQKAHGPLARPFKRCSAHSGQRATRRGMHLHAQNALADQLPESAQCHEPRSAHRALHSLQFSSPFPIHLADFTFTALSTAGASKSLFSRPFTSGSLSSRPEVPPGKPQPEAHPSTGAIIRGWRSPHRLSRAPSLILRSQSSSLHRWKDPPRRTAHGPSTPHVRDSLSREIHEVLEALVGVRGVPRHPPGWLRRHRLPRTQGGRASR